MNVIKEDKCFVEWTQCLKPQTAATYQYGIIRFCDYTGKTPTELINEAREDYLNKVAPWEARYIKQIEGFVSSFNDIKRWSNRHGKMANWTLLNYIKSIKHFFKFYKIPFYELNNHGIVSKATEAYLDIPALTLEDIRKAVQITGNNKLLKALILTLLSSGQGQAEVQKLKGKHLKNVMNGVAIVNMTRI